MALDLSLAIPQPRLSTLEGLNVELSVENRGPDSIMLPSPDDTSGAWGFEFFDRVGKRVCRSDGVTHQQMMSSARVDSEVRRDELAAGAKWSWSVDLASYHYGLPSGRYRLEATCRIDDASNELRSRATRVEVLPSELEDVAWTRDNPVLDGLTALFTTRVDGQKRYCLRQYNAPVPLASWYSEEIDFGDAGRIVRSPFVATTSFFKTDSFDHFFDRWIVWQQDDTICAKLFAFGRPTGEAFEAPLPAGSTLIRSANLTESGELWVFTRTGTGTLTCWVLDASGLREVFRHTVPVGDSIEPIVQADCHFVHVVTADGGVLYDRLGHDGSIQERSRPYKTRLPARKLEFDPVSRRLKAMFVEAPHGRTVAMVVVGPNASQVREQRFDPLPFRGDVREIDFDYDQQGRFHLLVTTSHDRLYYYSDGRGPHAIGEGQSRFFPRVMAPAEAFLGFFENQDGYRFYKFDRLRPGPKLQRRED